MMDIYPIQYDAIHRENLCIEKKKIGINTDQGGLSYIL